MPRHSRFRRYPVGLLALLVLTTAARPANDPSRAATRSLADIDVSSLELQMLDAINHIRLEQGLERLRWDARSLEMAEEQAIDMAEHGYFDHTRPSFPDRNAELFSQRVRRFGFRGGVGENLSTSSGGVMPQESLQAAVDGWMESPGHRANILNPGYKFTGIAHYRWAERVPTRRGNRIQWHDNWVQIFFNPR